MIKSLHFGTYLVVSFKGNNIHGLGTNALAKMIRQNSTIKS